MTEMALKIFQLVVVMTVSLICVQIFMRWYDKREKVDCGCGCAGTCK
jgi:hypothetical protein